MGQSSRLDQEDSLDEEWVCRSQSDSEDNHGSAVFYDAAAEVAVVNQLAVVEGRGGDQNSMAVGDMEDLAAVVMAHLLSVGHTDNYRHGIEHAPLESVDAVVAVDSETGVVLVKAVEFGEARGDRQMLFVKVVKESFLVVVKQTAYSWSGICLAEPHRICSKKQHLVETRRHDRNYSAGRSPLAGHCCWPWLYR